MREQYTCLRATQLPQRSWASTLSYAAWVRRSRALVSVGHEERLRQHEYMPVRLARHDRPSKRTRPSARGYELLLALRLQEEGKDRKSKTFLELRHGEVRRTPLPRTPVTL